MTKVDRADIDAQIAASIKNFSMLAKDEASRQRFTIDMPDFIRKKAALISAHFLLPAGARVLDLACGTGEVTYTIALLNPRVGIIGLDRDPANIEFARKNYRLPNLTFRQSDITALEIEDESIDGIINSNVLHRVYSDAGYDTEAVLAMLEKQIRKLKVGGTMLIRDYMLPADGNRLVFLELPNLPSEGESADKLSDADLLVRFSQTARPMQNGCEGFFIEEVMPRREGTRLFRLPHKWALEFVHRKDSRAKWEEEIHEEYTFYNYQDYRREFARLGMRMVFSSPYANPWVVANCFKGRFQLYNEDDVPMPYPATNYFIVAQKVADRQSLALEERRPSQKPVGELQIVSVRDRKTGKLHELVKRPGEYCDIIPYRITPDNRLLMYVRSGSPRPVVNAVARGAVNIDGKKWSGHLIEPVTMDTSGMTEDVDTNRRAIFGYVQGFAGLRPKRDDAWFVGHPYFPSPDRIDEVIEPVFIEVENPQKTSWTIENDADSAFSEAGMVTELDASDIILSSQVGLLPEPRLEIHAFELMMRHNIRLPEWIGEMMPSIPCEKIKTAEPEELLKQLEAPDFEPEKKGGVSLKAVKSVFVEEGKSGRSVRNLSAQDVEFVISEEGVDNVAVILPLSRDWDDNLLVALEPQIAAVPNRLGGDGAMLNAPSFNLPRDIKSIDDAKMFVAEKFKVSPDKVVQLGESYFTHTGVTPQRIFPFAVAADERAVQHRGLRCMMIKKLWKLYMTPAFRRASNDLFKLMIRVQLSVDDNNDLKLNVQQAYKQYQAGYELRNDKERLDTGQTTSAGMPSRILGQRGGAQPGAAPVMPPVKAAAAPAVKVVHTGPRLMQSYAEAKKLPVTGRIEVRETPAVARVDQAIDAVGEQLKKAEGGKKTKAELRAEKPKLEPRQISLDLIADPATRKGRR